ncbi:MAG TPA: polysaccharide deacetylase family protein [Chitinophagaceae bacterium]|jgi:peptidoglycan/xylan/chitin deacetylase (PgdA/CDA1 family)|nr:polysaccharide deacetylase family protein [Chitinophagaceae bacterium]
MESSSDDGDPAATSRAKVLGLVLLFLCACSQQVKESSRSVARVRTAPPPAAKEVAKAPPKKKKKKLYLTFDDGPNRGTGNVLHITRDEQVPVTFFIIGEHVFASSVQRRTWDSLQMAEHIALCNHSYSHAHNRFSDFYADPDSVVRDFRRAQDSLQLGNAIVRTPGRNIWRIDSLQFTDLKQSAAAADSLQQAGFVVMGWDLEWKYDHRKLCVTHSAEEIVAQIDSLFARGKTTLPDHLVLLAHDQVYDTPDDSLQLRRLLQLLKGKEGYELVLATGFPGARN